MYRVKPPTCPTRCAVTFAEKAKNVPAELSEACHVGDENAAAAAVAAAPTATNNTTAAAAAAAIATSTTRRTITTTA